MSSEAIVKGQKQEPVASYWHSLGFLGIVAAVVIMGYAAQHRQVAGGGLAESHAHVIPIYASVTVMDGCWCFLHGGASGGEAGHSTP